VVILPRILKAGDEGLVFGMNRECLRNAVYRGYLRAFPHPTLSAISEKDLTAEQKIELFVVMRPRRIRS
jgi:hypothetical protein